MAFGRISRYVWTKFEVMGGESSDLESILHANDEEYNELTAANPLVVVGAMAQEAFDDYTISVAQRETLEKLGIPIDEQILVDKLMDLSHTKGHIAYRLAEECDPNLANAIFERFKRFDIDIRELPNEKKIVRNFIRDYLKQEPEAQKSDSSISRRYVVPGKVYVTGGINSSYSNLMNVLDLAGNDPLVIIGILGTSYQTLKVVRTLARQNGDGKTHLVKGPWEHGVKNYEMAIAPTQKSTDSGRIYRSIKGNDDFIPPSSAILSGVDTSNYFDNVGLLVEGLEFFEPDEYANGADWISAMEDHIKFDDLGVSWAAGYCGLESEFGYFSASAHVRDPEDPLTDPIQNDGAIAATYRAMKEQGIDILFVNSSMEPGILEITRESRTQELKTIQKVIEPNVEYNLCEGASYAYIIFTGSDILGTTPIMPIEFDKAKRSVKWIEIS